MLMEEFFINTKITKMSFFWSNFRQDENNLLIIKSSNTKKKINKITLNFENKWKLVVLRFWKVCCPLL